MPTRCSWNFVKAGMNLWVKACRTIYFKAIGNERIPPAFSVLCCKLLFLYPPPVWAALSAWRRSPRNFILLQILVSISPLMWKRRQCVYETGEVKSCWTRKTSKMCSVLKTSKTVGHILGMKEPSYELRTPSLRTKIPATCSAWERAVPHSCSWCG